MLLRWLPPLVRWRGALGLAAASGVLYFLGFTGFGHASLAWICLVPVLWALDNRQLGGGMALSVAWVFGCVSHMGGYYWMVGMLQKFAHLSWFLAFAAYLLLCLFQGLLLAAWGWSVHHLKFRHDVALVWSVPTLMVLMEWWWPAIFPSYLANSQYRWIEMIQFLDVAGPLALTFLLSLASAVVYQTVAVLMRKSGQLPWAAGSVLGVLALGNWFYGVGAIVNYDDTIRVQDNRRVRIGLVQTNMGIYDKRTRPGEGLRRYREQSLELRAQGAELIIWPESGYQYPIPAQTTQVEDASLLAIGRPLLFGGLRVDVTGDRRRLYNSAFLIDGEGRVLGTYDKTFLLAFGEYLPGGRWFPSLYDLSPHTSRFDRGTHTEPLELNGVRYGVLICYEDILPGFVRQVMQHRPDVLVNLTNDAWFGDTHEPVTHFALATFRAVEHRRYLVRATNTGISGFVDPVGRIVDPTPVFSRANRLHEVTPLSGRTVYARLGDWPGLGALLVVLVWLRGPLGRFVRRGLRWLGRRLRPPRVSPSSQPGTRKDSIS